MRQRRGSDLDDRITKFLDNHWPSMERRVGRVEGQIYVLLGLGGITIAGIITVLVKAW